MRKQIIYEFNWWREDDLEITSSKNRDLLEVYAEQEIIKMRKTFYTSGNLIKTIDDITYICSWSVNFKTL